MYLYKVYLKMTRDSSLICQAICLNDSLSRFFFFFISKDFSMSICVAPLIRFVLLFSHTPQTHSQNLIYPPLFIRPHHSKLRGFGSQRGRAFHLHGPIRYSGANRLFTFSFISHALTTCIYFAQDLSVFIPALQRDTHRCI